MRWINWVKVGCCALGMVTLGCQMDNPAFLDTETDTATGTSGTTDATTAGPGTASQSGSQSSGSNTGSSGTTSTTGTTTDASSSTMNDTNPTSTSTGNTSSSTTMDDTTGPVCDNECDQNYVDHCIDASMYKGCVEGCLEHIACDVGFCHDNDGGIDCAENPICTEALDSFSLEIAQNDEAMLCQEDANCTVLTEACNFGYPQMCLAVNLETAVLFGQLKDQWTVEGGCYWGECQCDGVSAVCVEGTCMIGG